MEASTQTTNYKPDELDLINLLEKGLTFFRNFGKWIIIFSIAGIAAGVLHYLNSPKKYSSRLILHSVILTNQEQIEIIDTWKGLLKKREYITLADVMNCDVNKLKKLSSIDATEIQKLYVQNNPNGFIVDVLVLDTGILTDLQKGIVHGLENSNYVKERVESKKADLNNLIEKVKGEIVNLDSTKTAIANIINNKNKNSSSLMIDVSGINVQWVGLNEKLMSYQEDLKFIRAVQVLQDFNKLSKPEEPKLLKSLFFGFIIGFLIGYTISLFLYVRNRLKIRATATQQLSEKSNSSY
jgi:hypothetical protein